MAGLNQDQLEATRQMHRDFTVIISGNVSPEQRVEFTAKYATYPDVIAALSGNSAQPVATVEITYGNDGDDFGDLSISAPSPKLAQFDDWGE